MVKNLVVIGFIFLVFLCYIAHSFSLDDPLYPYFSTKKPALNLSNFNQTAKGFGKIIGDVPDSWVSLFGLQEGEGNNWKLILSDPEDLKLYKPLIDLSTPIKFTDKTLDDFVARKHLSAIVQAFKDKDGVPTLIITSLDGNAVPLLEPFQTMTVPLALNLDGKWFAIPLKQSVRLIEPILYINEWWKNNRNKVVFLLAIMSLGLIIYTKIYLTPGRTTNV